jgi:hypothetical protein
MTATAISDAELKLSLIRVIDRLPKERLIELCDILDIESVVAQPKENEQTDEAKSEDDIDPRDEAFAPLRFNGDIEEGYADLARDKEDQKEAKEWINGTIDSIQFDD